MARSARIPNERSSTNFARRNAGFARACHEPRPQHEEAADEDGRVHVVMRAAIPQAHEPGFRIERELVPQAARGEPAVPPRVIGRQLPCLQVRSWHRSQRTADPAQQPIGSHAGTSS
jgi:hypothetical protein